MNSDHPAHGLRVRYLGGPTALIEIGGVRLLTDPTFDPAGDIASGTRTLTKTLDAVLAPEEIGPLDAVLLSHDQHTDNLDRSGRAFLEQVPLTVSTASAHERLGGSVQALPNWETVELPRPDGGSLRITGVPAQHGPDGSEHLVGEVTGFVLSGAGLPSVYISGDNASLDVVRTIAARLGPFDVTILFAGAAKTALLDGALLTLGSEQAAEAATMLGSGPVIVMHFEGWAHFSQGADTVREAFARAGLTDRLHLPQLGEEINL
jgi:L-ascorbate metabolism protein UlaG (beta-lactamase superfamily)